MVRRYCDPSDQMDYFRRPNRSIPTQASRENARSFATNNHSSSPNHDSEDEKAENPPRRRIALAVRPLSSSSGPSHTPKRRADTESSVPAVERGRLSVAVTLAMAARTARMQERSLGLVSF